MPHARAADGTALFYSVEGSGPALLLIAGQSITAPTLVVHGTDDIFNPTANAPLITERIPGARMHLIEGARHGYFEEFRAVATPLVTDFLSP